MKKMILLLVGLCLTATTFSQNRTEQLPCLPGEMLIFYTTNISPYDTVEINKRATKWLGMDCKPRYGVDKDLLLQQTKINFYVCKDTTATGFTEKGISESLKKDLEDLKKLIKELKEKECPDCILQESPKEVIEPKDSNLIIIGASPFFEKSTYFPSKLNLLVSQDQDLFSYVGTEIWISFLNASTSDIKKLPFVKKRLSLKTGIEISGWKMRLLFKNGVSCDTCWSWFSTPVEIVGQGTVFFQGVWGSSKKILPNKEMAVTFGSKYRAVEYIQSLGFNNLGLEGVGLYGGIDLKFFNFLHLETNLDFSPFFTEKEKFGWNAKFKIDVLRILR